MTKKTDLLQHYEQRQPRQFRQFDGGLTRFEAEDMAAKCQGYSNVVAFRAAHQTNLKRK
jgi:hypothetical protein